MNEIMATLNGRYTELAEQQRTSQAFGDKAELAGRMEAAGLAISLAISMSNSPINHTAEDVIVELRRLQEQRRQWNATERVANMKANYIGTIQEVDSIIETIRGGQ